MAKRLTANDLNRRITIQKKGLEKDAAGYPVPNPGWIEIIKGKVWAAREPLKGREFFAANAARAEITVRYKIRYRLGITSNMRLIDHRDNRIYEIIAPLDDVFDDRTETHLMVKELTNG